MNTETFKALSGQLEGELFWDKTLRTLYATDASAYRELPQAVALPKTVADIQKLVNFASEHKTSLIPRTAGTSLAGQVVGSGIVVDVSKHFTGILEVNEVEKWVRVQPGVIRDELNMHLANYGLFFGPETSTANRAMIGGMIGNNSCGSNSVVYGSTRDHLLSVSAVLADGTLVEFESLDKTTLQSKCEGAEVSGDLEQQIYQGVHELLSDQNVQNEIDREFPKASIPRRNTGYAVDLLKNTEPFTATNEPFNFCKLLAGSEGTLAFITEAKLSVNPLPPKEIGLLCVHFESIYDSLLGNLIALKYQPSACELMDHYIFECTKNNIEQRANRFFVKGDPKAVLVVEIRGETIDEVERQIKELEEELKTAGLGYHFPVVTGADTKKVWNLRKAGLGLLSNMPGDAKPVPVIEDTAVDVEDLPDYIKDFNEILKKHDLYSVHYAHAGSGELHLRPIIDLKTAEGNRLFRIIADEIAHLVKKYKGSLSGEHGDGRLRGEFIPFMIGEKNYELLKQVKRLWDPHNVFNPGKIVDTPSMNSSLRFTPGQGTRQVKTVLNFGDTQGIQRAAEQCNGSGDCRKTELTGGTMCPSYMATRNEKETTRARANILRETITRSTDNDPLVSEEIYEVMDLCLSCKGCKSECPSNVDVGKMKAEFLHHYQEARGIKLRTKLIANFTKLNKLASLAPWAYNFVFTNSATSKLAKNISGFAADRSIPLLAKTTLKSWYQKNRKHNFGEQKTQVSRGKVYLFCDEFTNYNDANIGITTIQLLTRLGYEVIIPAHVESGRTFLSKGLLKQAKSIALKNISLLKGIVTENSPLIGIEPSAILTFRDEYVDLADPDTMDDAKALAKNTFTIEEFLAQELDKGALSQDLFSSEERTIKLHGHCHQKALSSLTPTKKILSQPPGYQVHLIRSGCCGMAGSFGYEKEHYDISMQIGELVLFPTVRQQPEDVIIAAPGTSCRHQIKDGTGRIAKHPVEILYEALR
ncbi:MAG: FAD-linked oxidase C-terminal domain-containing protein [Bacteroidota bacterium]